MSNPAGKQIAVGEKIQVTVVNVKGATIWLGADAPPSAMAERTEHVSSSVQRPTAVPGEICAESRCEGERLRIAASPEGQASASRPPPGVATMTMNDSAWSQTNSPQVRTTFFHVGERIEIIAGPLRGLRGTVLHLRGAGQLLVAADGWGPGAFLEVSERLVAKPVPS